MLENCNNQRNPKTRVSGVNLTAKMQRSRFGVIAASSAWRQTANGTSPIVLETAFIVWRILPSVEKSTKQKIS
jgi:hypothetical protein